MTRSRRSRPAGREFPWLGQRGIVPPAGTLATFFVTAPAARVGATSDGGLAAEGGPFHAKRMGTSLTACGELAISWPKLWEVPFDAAGGPLCQGCVDAVAASRESQPQRAVS
ncbi:hypothetical protein J2X46_003278 [Nocardioides sp. BE266]|nr:hypothetical protein [Nocardioides sp. BE266]